MTWFSRKVIAAKNPIPVGEVEGGTPPSAVAVAEENVPVSSPMQPQMDEEYRGEYLQIAKELGIEDAGYVLSEKFRSFAAAEGIQIFDTFQVVKYLDDKLGPDWKWRGLRLCDVEHLKEWHMDGVRRTVYFHRRQYNSPVPLPVLYTVKKILAQFPNLYFYINDKGTAENGDPFLMVTSREMNGFIIERWDEPSYRGK